MTGRTITAVMDGDQMEGSHVRGTMGHSMRTETTMETYECQSSLPLWLGDVNRISTGGWP